jgi:anti-sigma-K factor RskA
MSDRDEQLLARFFDGELTEAEAAEFEAQLADEPALQADLDALAFTQTAVRDLVSAQVEAQDFSTFFAAVEARLPAMPDPAPAEPVAVKQPGALSRVSAWWRSYWTPVLASAVAAAGVAWFVSSRAADDLSGGSIIVDGVQNDGPQTVLISQPEEDGGTTVIWLLDDEQETGEGFSPDEEDPI